MVRGRLRVLALALALVLAFALPVMAAPPGPGTGTDIPSGPIKPITVTAPQGGEVWQAGIERTITWKYVQTLFKAKTVKIVLLKNGSVAETIAASAPVGANGQGSFKWSTLNVAPGTGYQIKVVGNPLIATTILDKSLPSDTSGKFTMGEKAKITITFPATAGQNLLPGQHVTITWDYSGDIGSTVYLRLIHASDLPHGGLFDVLVDNDAPAGSGGHGSYQWVIPGNLPVSSTYFFDIGCEYAGTGASGKQFRIGPLVFKPLDD